MLIPLLTRFALIAAAIALGVHGCIWLPITLVTMAALGLAVPPFPARSPRCDR